MANIWDAKVRDTLFVGERESRYGKWKNQMEQMDIKGKILGLDLGKNWAAASGQRYVKDRNGSRFRSQSGGAGFNRYRSKSGGTGDRSRSQPRQKSELANDEEVIKKKMNEMMAVLNELKKAQANCVNNFVEEE